VSVPVLERGSRTGGWSEDQSFGKTNVLTTLFLPLPVIGGI
jgi:hypothetical protein